MIVSYFGIIKNLINIAINDASRVPQFNCNEMKILNCSLYATLKFLNPAENTKVCAKRFSSCHLPYHTFNLINDNWGNWQSKKRPFWVAFKSVRNTLFIIINRTGARKFNVQLLSLSWKIRNNYDLPPPLIGIICMGLLAVGYIQWTV